MNMAIETKIGGFSVCLGRVETPAPASRITWERRITGECSDLREVPAGARVVTIDDMEVVGICEGCGEHLTDADEYEMDGEGIYLCQRCANDISEEK